ncbi:DUF1311 domain-containing protein [Roseovarius spongiae]|uniref:DUF1311 domain-containing protein n=1 Tax=Roseovarius spongiae TaxID=2320272 RepID=A0A3A8AV70_9RHOB|nr:lysozyme inhibitor LprI family protein [Roseovarius spongiae]RKF14988.1 DUF1311 domain-containing protein [Roseovarius spongiae]
MRLASGLAGLAMMAGAAVAQDAPPIDTVAVRACMAQTPLGVVQPDCIGRASNACQARPGGDTTIGITECIMAETQVWDAMLNEEYKAVRRMFRSEGGEGLTVALRDAQRAWIAFRDAECGLAYSRWAGGSIRTIVAANCQLGMTAQRTLELRDMRAN